MNLVPYFRYFFYVAWHWNLLLAFFIIYYEIIGERKYHIHTIGQDELEDLKNQGIDISHATMYMPINYYVLEHLMKEIVKYPGNKTFLDIGCGKGRAMIVAASYEFDQITGIDFSKQFCEEAATTIHDFSLKNAGPHFKVITTDAFGYKIPKDITTIFFFNPFDETIMKEVVSNIIKSQQTHPRTIRVLYANPQHKTLFLDKNFKEIFHFKKLKYLEGTIFGKKGISLPFQCF